MKVREPEGTSTDGNRGYVYVFDALLAPLLGCREGEVAALLAAAARASTDHESVPSDLAPVLVVHSRDEPRNPPRPREVGSSVLLEARG